MRHLQCCTELLSIHGGSHQADLCGYAGKCLTTNLISTCSTTSIPGHIENPIKEDVFVQPPPKVYQHRPVVWKLHRAWCGLRTSPKKRQEHLHSTLRCLELHQLQSDRCVWVKLKDVVVLASADDLLIPGKSRDTTSFLTQLQQAFSLKHTTILSTEQPLRFLGKRIFRHPNGDVTTSLERAYVYSKGSHLTSCIPNRVGMATTEAQPPLPQGDDTRQVPHLTSNTSRTF